MNQTAAKTLLVSQEFLAGFMFHGLNSLIYKF